MKTALGLALILALATPVRAAEPDIAMPVENLPKPNGYNLLVEAAKTYVEGEEGSPATEETLSPAEDLRRQRATVGRNAKVLDLTRQALALPIQQPPFRDFTAYMSVSARWRAVARLLRQEASVRAADGDWNGAVQSHLDAIEMGVTLSRGGPLLTFLTSRAIEAIGRRDLEKSAIHLDAAQSQTAAKRLEKIEQLRPALREIIQQEKLLSVQQLEVHFASPQWKEMLKDGKNFPDGAIDEGQAAHLRHLSADDIKNNILLAFEIIEANSRLPYPTLKPTVPTPADEWTRMTIQTVNKPFIRFHYEQSRTENRLLHDALLLRAAKLETGVYPAEFLTSRDPFSDNTNLVYRRDGESYQLYSIGPNGKDNGGAPIQTVETDEKSGIKKIIERLQVNSTGDILGPVL